MKKSKENPHEKTRRRHSLTLAACTLTLLTNYAPSSARQQPPHLVLQSSADDAAYEPGVVPKRLAVPPRDARKLYLLDARAGNVLLHDRDRGATKKIVTPVTPGKAEALAADHRGLMYILDSDSVVHLVGPAGNSLGHFTAPGATSLAALGGGNVVVAAPRDGKLLHLYSPKGERLGSFGEMTTFEPDNRAQNDFYNRGGVAVGPSDEIYFIPWYAPTPHVQKFSAEGRLIREFKVEGVSVELQAERTKDFWRRKSRAGCTGGYRVVNAAAVDPSTGHLWLGLNGLSTTGVVYEYGPDGRKLREYSFLHSSPADSRPDVITGVRELAVQGAGLHLISRDKVYLFDKGGLAAGAGATRKAAPHKKWGLFSTSAPASFGAPRPASPAPLRQTSCPAAQQFDCDANCASGSQSATVDCDAEISSQLGTDRIVTSSTCTRREISGNSLGGCRLEVQTCNISTGVTGSSTTEINCQAQPTPTPPPPSPTNPETPPPDQGGGGRRHLVARSHRHARGRRGSDGLHRRGRVRSERRRDARELELDGRRLGRRVARP